MTTPTTSTRTPAPNPAVDGLDDPALADELRAEGHLDDEQDGQDGQQDDEGTGRGRNAEAARRRVELREVQAERDGLRERVVGLQRAEVLRIAGEQLAQAGDLFEVGQADLDELLDDDGNVDPDAVTEAVADLLADRPGLRATPPPPGGGVPRHGLGYRRPTTSVAPSWADVVRNGG